MQYPFRPWHRDPNGIRTVHTLGPDASKERCHRSVPFDLTALDLMAHSLLLLREGYDESSQSF